MRTLELLNSRKKATTCIDWSTSDINIYPSHLGHVGSWKSSKWSIVIIFSETNLYKSPKFAIWIFGLKMTPHFGTFPKNHPFWYCYPSLRPSWSLGTSLVWTSNSSECHFFANIGNLVRIGCSFKYIIKRISFLDNCSFPLLECSKSIHYN